MKQCPKCSNQNQDNAIFCSLCGSRLNANQNMGNEEKTYIRVKNYLYDRLTLIIKKMHLFLHNTQQAEYVTKKKLSIIALFAVVIVMISAVVLGYLFISSNNRTYIQKSTTAESTIVKCDECGGDGNTCTHCRGGACPRCSGSGDIYKIDGYKNGVAISNRYRCDTCNGTGKCPVCNGRSTCNACRGTGHELKYTGEDYCPTCKGDGICTTCNGFGECPKCDGRGFLPRYGKEGDPCTVCFGSGKCSNNCNNGYCPQCNGTGKKL